MADTEIDTKVVEEVTEPVNAGDDVRNDVRAAMDSLKGDDGAEKTITGEEGTKLAGEVIAEHLDSKGDAAPSKADHPTDPNRFIDGTFKPTKTDAAPVKAAAPEQKSPPADIAAKASPPTPRSDVAPPAGWAADGKQAWAALQAALPTLPADVQASISAIQAAAVKREQAMEAGGQQWSETKRRYEAIVNPIAQEAQRRGLSPEEGAQRLLDGQTFLEQQPEQAILWLSRRHNINLAELATNPPAPQAPVRSEATIPPEFVQHVSSLEDRLRRMDERQNIAIVAEFGAKNPYFAEIPEEQLVGIMSEIKAANPTAEGLPLLQAAYDRAIWLNQDVREKLIAERQAQTQQTATQKVVQKAAQASKAAVSVKGSSADTRPPPKPNGAGDTVYDSVRESIRQLQSA